MTGPQRLISDIRDQYSAVFDGWENNVEFLRERGQMVLRLDHPLSPGLIFDAPAADESDASALAEMVFGSEFLEHEMESVGTAPSGLNAELALGVRNLAAAFEWQQATIASLAGVLVDAGLIDPSVAAWLPTYAAPFRPS